MTQYKHMNTGAIAELIEQKENTVVLKIVETKERKEIGLATFKRWWKPYEIEVDLGEPEPFAELEIPAEPTRPEAPKAEKVTPGPADDETPQTLSEIISKLEKLFHTLNDLYFESKLPAPIITVQSSPKSFGHCSTKKVWKKNAEGEDEGQYELNIGAEFLNRPSEYTAAVMMHEMVHLHCIENGLEDTCQNGRYHNKVFMQECESRDLVVEYNRTSGYYNTLPSAEFIKNLQEKGFALKVTFARYTIERAEKKAERAKAHAYVCEFCGQTVRTTQELNLICGDCDYPMERAN